MKSTGRMWIHENGRNTVSRGVATIKFGGCGSEDVAPFEVFTSKRLDVHGVTVPLLHDGDLTDMVGTFDLVN